MKTYKELLSDIGAIEEGKMKELHGYIEDGLSAKEIAKIMKLDVKTIEKLMSEELLNEVKFPWIVIDTADDNKVVAMASDESDAKDSIRSAERPPMNIKDKSTLKIVKTRKKQHAGMPLVEGQYSKKGTKKFHVKTDSGSWDSYLIDGLRLKINGNEVRLVTSSGVPNNLGNIGFNMKPEGSDASVRKIIRDANTKHKGDMAKVAKEISSKIKLKVEVIGTVKESVELLDETLKDYFDKQVKSQEDAKKLSKSQLATLKKEYAKVDKIDPTTPAYKRMRNKLTSLPDVVLQQIVDAEIKFLRVDAASIIKGRKS